MPARGWTAQNIHSVSLNLLGTRHAAQGHAVSAGACRGPRGIRGKRAGVCAHHVNMRAALPLWC